MSKETIMGSSLVSQWLGFQMLLLPSHFQAWIQSLVGEDPEGHVMWPKEKKNFFFFLQSSIVYETETPFKTVLIESSWRAVIWMGRRLVDRWLSGTFLQWPQLGKGCCPPFGSVSILGICSRITLSWFWPLWPWPLGDFSTWLLSFQIHISCLFLEKPENSSDWKLQVLQEQIS